MSDLGAYRADFERLPDDPARVAAFTRFEAAGFPHKKLEDWRFTSLKALTDRHFTAVDVNVDIDIDVDMDGLSHLTGHRIVFIDGRLGPADALPTGVEVDELSPADIGDDPGSLAALNAAFFAGGAKVTVAPNTVVDAPIALVFIDTGRDHTVNHPRVVIEAGENSRATFFQSHVTLEAGASWTNAVMQQHLGPGANVDFVKLHLDGEASTHIATTNIRLDRDARLTSTTVVLGGALVRNEIDVELAGQGAFAQMDGAYVLGNKQHCDFTTVMRHAVPHCDSDQLYKGVFDGRSTGIFSGKVVVDVDAQKSNAVQQNRNLLVSETASANTKPQLEIYADDVKCAHGATVGQLDEDALFYLRARGLDTAAARQLLTFGFASEVIERIRHTGARDALGAMVRERLLGT